MKQTGPSVYANRGLAAAALLGLLGLAACGTVPGQAQQPAGKSSSSASGSATAASPSSTPTPDPVSFSPSVKDGAKGVKVSSVVSVGASGGTLSKVSLKYKGVTRMGKAISGTVAGSMNSDKTGWTADDRLEPSATYTLSASGTSKAGTPGSAKSTFTTQALTSAQEAFPVIFPQKNTTVGVGMPVILTFDRPIADKKTVEKHLSVTTSPKQTGSWSWISSTEVHYRPKKFWTAGTKVSVDADLNGLNAGNGIYGQNSISTKFTIGRSQVTKINLSSDVAKVYRNGKKVRTIYVSGGKPGWQTRSGIKLIMSKETNKKMTNEMIGAKEDYDLTVAYALRITNSGEFLHSAPWNAGYFGRANASHGCVGMSTSDAAWLYESSLIGDPTETTGTSRGMERVNGWSDWNVSWSSWKKGSAR